MGRALPGNVGLSSRSPAWVAGPSAAAFPMPLSGIGIHSGAAWAQTGALVDIGSGLTCYATKTCNQLFFNHIVIRPVLERPFLFACSEFLKINK